MKIHKLHARQILDSRGNPTVEADLWLDDGFGRAAVPSGASTGALEAVELRDGGDAYAGKGVLQAVANVNDEIAEAFTGATISDQAELDTRLRELDGSDNLGRLGANATLAASLAFAHARANSRREQLFESLGCDSFSLPVPLLNILNGGAHADNNVDIQEFMIAPVGFERFSDALQASVEIYHALKARLRKAGLATAVGDEGGFAPDLRSNAAALDLIVEAISAAGYTAGKDIWLALDVASSEIYHDGRYELASESRQFEAEEFAGYLKDLCDRYPIVSIEDGMAEDDWDGWIALTRELGERVQLVGDDLFVTNPVILRRGIERGAGNAILIKPNQIGTLTSTLDAIDTAARAGFAAVLSHRSGETEDTTIAHLAVATEATQIKTGAPCRSDRTAKYNELLRIEEALGSEAAFAGSKAFAVAID